MESEGGIEGRDFMDEVENVTVVDNRVRRSEDHSSALAEKLLQGWTLLNEHCPQCITPLVRNRQKKIYCAACRQWILTEAEAATMARQHRVDIGDLAEQNRNTSHEQLAPLSAIPPGHQTNGKSTEVGHFRLATSRAEEKAPDSRNAKRFASSDHGQDGLPRLALMDGKENGNSKETYGLGVATTFQREAADIIPSQVPPKQALVLQPAVNPVNDILVVRRTLTTLHEKLEGIRQLISNSQDVNELRQLFVVLQECIHSIQVIRQLLKSVE